MNTADLTTRLHDLPPELTHPVDRFAEVRQQVRRRRQHRLAVISVGAVAVVLTAVPLALHLNTRASSEPLASQATDTTPPTSPSQTDGGTTAPNATGPGEDRIIKLSTPITITATGTTIITLGPRPADATAISTDLQCLSAGTFRWPDGASMTCSAVDLREADPRQRTSPGYIIDLKPRQDELVISAGANASWEIVTTYVKKEFIPAPVNANGNTYGSENEHGTPDLIAVAATNGQSGYAYARDFAEVEGPKPTSPADALAQQEANEGRTLSVPVYESDGTTQIGVFELG